MEIYEADDYPRKVERAINLLRSIPQDIEIELSYSGGKDSDVILELAKMAEVPVRAIYKNTTIDPPGTIKHCKEKGVEIIQPKKSFLKLISTNGAPTRFSRFCCSVLKEYKICDRAIQGIRKSESIARSKRYKEPEYCRVYNARDKAKIYLPILDWTDKDVEKFVKDRKIKCHPLYYDELGNFRVERRLGCIGCPMQADNGRGDFKKYPKLLKQRIKMHQIFFDTHPNSAAVANFPNAYWLTFYNLFCTSLKDYREKIATDLWGNKFDAEKFIKEYFRL